MIRWLIWTIFSTQPRQEDLVDLFLVAADHTHMFDDDGVEAPGSGCTEANPKLAARGQGFNYRKQNVAEELIESYKTGPRREKEAPGNVDAFPGFRFSLRNRVLSLRAHERIRSGT